MKYFSLLFSLFILSAITFLSSCGNDDPEPADKTRELLTGGTAKVWKISTRKYNGVNECIGTCELKYNKWRFSNDNQLKFSTYTCLEDPCEEGLSSTSQDGDTFTWTLNGNQLTLGGFFNITIVSISETELTLRTDFSGFIQDETFTAVPDDPFPTRTQFLAGTTSKTWKYEKRTVNGTEIPLSDCLLATRFTNFANGNLTTTYTNGCLANTSGTWRFEDGESVYVSEREGGPTIRFDIWELSTERLVISYIDGMENFVVLYQVPAGS
ncbi:MAG: lipocalin family protein [Cyclobacteriaceae bacterium]|nr:lipocalin family protein [Cyclobacteriaceae bacterium]